jgi:prepilin-type N-terminal cleavage/methylation domain-containing protein
MMGGRRHLFDSIQAGFTLAELLVATGVLALLCVALLNALQISGQLWSTTERRSRASADLASVEATVRQLVASSYPAVVPVASRGYRLTFAGSAHSLEFTGELPASAVRGGYYRMLLRTVPRAGTTSLILSWAPERNQAVRLAEQADSTDGGSELLTSVEKLSITYYGTKDGDRAASWHDAWVDQIRLPELIRFEIALRERQGRVDFYVRPMVTMDAGCIYDRLTRFCRGRTG